MKSKSPFKKSSPMGTSSKELKVKARTSLQGQEKDVDHSPTMLKVDNHVPNSGAKYKTGGKGIGKGDLKAKSKTSIDKKAPESAMGYMSDYKSSLKKGYK